MNSTNKFSCSQNSVNVNYFFPLVFRLCIIVFNLNLLNVDNFNADIGVNMSELISQNQSAFFQHPPCYNADEFVCLLTNMLMHKFKALFGCKANDNTRIETIL
jgi:hypothetical protein